MNTADIESRITRLEDLEAIKHLKIKGPGMSANDEAGWAK